MEKSWTGLRLAAFLVIAAAVAFGQEKVPGLPANAFVVETVPVPESVQRDRLIALWMIDAEKSEYKIGPEPQACPEMTRGSGYSGKTRVSLIDTAAHRVINTIEIHTSEDDRFEIPMLIWPGYYAIPKLTQKNAGKPKILDLRDFNGDGAALEFAFYEAEACMGLATALLGYSVQQDKLIQYEVDLTVLDGPRREERVEAWPDYLFHRKPIAPGKWRYTIDYSGRGGCTDSYVVNYSATAERFSGTVTYSNCPKEPQD